MNGKETPFESYAQKGLGVDFRENSSNWSQGTTEKLLCPSNKAAVIIHQFQIKLQYF